MPTNFRSYMQIKWTNLLKDKLLKLIQVEITKVNRLCLF